MEYSESKGGAMTTFDETNVSTLHCLSADVDAKEEHIPIP